MKKKFSEGEWRIIRGGIDVDIYDSTEITIIATVYEQVERGVLSANAKLIAAAPELLNALISVLNIMKDSEGVAGYHLNGDIAKWDEFDEIKQAEQAIKKATE